MSATSNYSAFQTKIYNESFAFKSSLWKLQTWLNQFRSKSASPSPASTISKSSKDQSNTNKNKKISTKSLNNLNRRKQENENNFRSIIEELQTMLSSHKRKYRIKRVKKKPTKVYALTRELRNIGENLNLSIDDEKTKTMTKITFGSKHSLSQFVVEIAFENTSCDIITDECSVDITLCQHENDDDDDDNDDDPYVDIQFNKIDTDSIKNDIKLIIDEGDFDKLTQKLLLIRYFDDFHNLFPNLLLKDLIIKDGNGKGSIHKEIELCMKELPLIIKYQRLLDGPSIIYAQQLIDSILNKIKYGKTWSLSFIGLYPAKCMIDYDGNNKLQFDKNIKSMDSANIKIKSIINDNNDNNDNNDKKEKEYLLYWFVLRPAIIVPLEIAKKIFNQCLGEIGYKFKEKKEKEMDENDKRSSHSSWIMDKTYSYHNMLIGDIDLKYRKPIEIFENEYQYFKFKTDQFMNGVKIEQIAIYDLKYKNKDNLKETTLCSIIHYLKNWVIMNQLYSQCFHHNFKKWKIKSQSKNIDIVSHKYQVNIRNVNHLEVRHLDGGNNNNNNNNNNNDIQYQNYRKENKLPPKLDNWIANFYTDCSKKDVIIRVTVQYWIFDNNKPFELDMIYNKKINTILQKTNSVPITLSYISKLFDARYFKQKIEMQQLKTPQTKQQNLEID